MTAVPKLDPDIKFLRFTWSSTCNVTRAKALFLPCCSKDLQEIADVGIAMAAVNQVQATCLYMMQYKWTASPWERGMHESQRSFKKSIDKLLWMQFARYAWHLKWVPIPTCTCKWSLMSRLENSIGKCSFIWVKVSIKVPNAVHIHYLLQYHVYL